jgi:hypothetical protein
VIADDDDRAGIGSKDIDDYLTQDGIDWMKNERVMQR